LALYSLALGVGAWGNAWASFSACPGDSYSFTLQRTTFDMEQWERRLTPAKIHEINVHTQLLVETARELVLATQEQIKVSQMLRERIAEDRAGGGGELRNSDCGLRNEESPRRRRSSFARGHGWLRRRFSDN
jgi:hypothetical protein